MPFQGTSILEIEPVSPAARAGLRAGDVVISCNNSPVRDWVDMLAVSSESSVSLSIKRGSLRRTVGLRRRPGTGWGIKLEGSDIRQCKNRCVFCFVDQQPPGLRNSLLVKDDDVRYSFLEGTYITLTPEQVEEAITRGFTSLHVSIQTTSPELRGRMLGHRKPLDILPLIDKLAARGVEVQAQIVEVPGWNDGEQLDNSVSDLFLRKNVTVLGVVPVGLTKWRKGLEHLNRPTGEQASRTLETLKKWQRRALVEREKPWVYPADEYYCLAGEEIPELSFYNDNALAANGIGLLAEMIYRCRAREFQGEGIVLTGTMAAPYIVRVLSGSRYRVIAVENTLMGSGVSVAGLMSGADVVRTLKKNHLQKQRIKLPSLMFNHDGLTLDEYTPYRIGRESETDVVCLNSIGELI
jgi:putative radical SAM enzyme (TIGR03279 family)